MTRLPSVLTIVVGVVLGIVLTVVGMTVVAATKSPDNDTLFGAPMGANQLFTGAGMLVGCEPHQVAMIRPSTTTMPHVQCVTAASAVTYAPYGYATVPVTASAPAVVAAPAAPRATATRTTSDRRDRSWKKSALIIGGSTATGAGVGGLVGGKKGALIGAAIGGGASSIYEATKR